MQRLKKYLIEVLQTLQEPMFTLLLFLSIIYFLLGEIRDGIIILIFICFIISVDLIQEIRTSNALKKLHTAIPQKAIILKDGKETETDAYNLRPGDIMIVKPGMKIQADGLIINNNSLVTEESAFTGENLPIIKSITSDKTDYLQKNYCYAQSYVLQGSAEVKITETGEQTLYGKIKKTAKEKSQRTTPLQSQINDLVKVCTYISTFFCIITIIFTFLQNDTISLSNRIIQSVISGVSLAMATIPEEFPVVLGVFFATCAYRLSKENALIRKPSEIETLGAVSVLCIDKTGTLTENKLKLKKCICHKTDINELLITSADACENNSRDPIEKAIFTTLNKENLKYPLTDIFYQYQFSSQTNLMGIVRKKGNALTLNVKGSPESILEACNLTPQAREEIFKKAKTLFKAGYRVIGVAKKEFTSEKMLPENLQKTTFEFQGLLVFEDPVRKNARSNINHLKRSGIRVVILTGDNRYTAEKAAKLTGISHKNIIDGNTISKLTKAELCSLAEDTDIFARVRPEQKQEIIKAFQSNGHITAMIGDGINDAPALKQADIGIAMGKSGTDISREVADIILLDDNLSTITKALNDSRTIYEKIKKSTAYIISIHIPILLSSLISPFLGLTGKSIILLPAHMALLEFIIDPTCSILFEKLPEYKHSIKSKPRCPEEKLLNKRSLLKSIVQGISVFLFSFCPFLYINKTTNVETARTFAIVAIMVANLFLVYVNQSDEVDLIKIISKLKKNTTFWISILLTILMISVCIYTPIRSFLNFSMLPPLLLIKAIISGVLSVLWWELLKIIKKRLA